MNERLRKMSTSLNKSYSNSEKIWKHTKKLISEKYDINDNIFWSTLIKVTDKLILTNERMDLSNLSCFITTNKLILESADEVEQTSPQNQFSIIQIDKTLNVNIGQLKTIIAQTGLIIDKIVYKEKSPEEIIPNILEVKLQSSIQKNQLQGITEQLITLLEEQTGTTEPIKSINNLFKILFIVTEDNDSVIDFEIQCPKYDFVLVNV